MSFNITARTPANGATQDPGTITLSVSYNMTGGTYIYQHKIDWRRNGGAWNTVTSNTPLYGAGSYTASVGMDSNDRIEWYMTAYWVDAGGSYHINLDGGPSAVWSVTPTPDTVDPTITSVTPATGNVSPGATGVTFAATLADNYELADGKLYIDSVLANTWTSAGAKVYTTSLSLGAHTYRWTATDEVGNTADTGTVNITVINGLPEVPSGTITVAGQTGAVTVANLGDIWVYWPAFLDGNPEDTLTYTLEERAAEGSWAQVATGITGLTYEWTPDLGLGAVELRVKSNDGTADSAAYLTRTGITVLSSQSPNAPTLIAPGAVTWREGETREVTWTAASPEHPEGVACTYEIQFSAAGDFSDLVVITTTADDGTYDWTLATDLVVADTATCKLRVRAIDGYSKASTWSTSGAFTVQENDYPTITLVSPTDGGLTSGNTPYLQFDVDDPDADGVHIEVMLSLTPSFGTTYYWKSSLSQDDWEEAASPYSSWTDLVSGGATAGNRVRFTCPPLRYDLYFMRYRATDGILYTEWSDVISFRVTPSGALPVSCTIGAESYSVIGLEATERTGGEASPFSFRVPLSVLVTKPITRGSSVSVGLAIDGQSRVWNGTVEGLVSSGAEVTVACVMDDAYLSRKLVTGDESSADIGAILADFVTDYGAPLTDDHMDTTLGVTVAVKGQYKSLLDHLREWAQLLGLILYVDSDGEVHLEDPNDLADPSYILYEAYE